MAGYVLRGLREAGGKASGSTGSQGTGTVQENIWNVVSARTGHPSSKGRNIRATGSPEEGGNNKGAALCCKPELSHHQFPLFQTAFLQDVMTHACHPKTGRWGQKGLGYPELHKLAQLPHLRKQKALWANTQRKSTYLHA